MGKAYTENNSYWIKVTKTYSDFTASATSESINLFVLPSGYALIGRVMKHTTAFNGTSWSACTLEIGITITTDKYLSASDVFQAVSDTLIFEDNVFYIENWGSDIQVLLTAKSTGGNLSVGTAGDVEIYYKVQKIK